MKKLTLSIVLLSLIFSVAYSQGGIHLRDIDGFDGVGLISNSWVTFHMGLSNHTGYNINGISNGFRFYSPDGAEWTGPEGSWAQVLEPYCTLYFGVNTFGDTIGFGCTSLSPAIPDGFDQEALSISIWIDISEMHKTICLDSAFFPPTGTWIWSLLNFGAYVPNWNGPHCFEVTNYTWRCADIDNNGTVADVADLTYFVDYLFGGGPMPVFPFSSDVNGDSSIDITDLTYLVDYMFSGGRPPDCF